MRGWRWIGLMVVVLLGSGRLQAEDIGCVSTFARNPSAAPLVVRDAGSLWTRHVRSHSLFRVDALKVCNLPDTPGSRPS
jgi:hypothetical protein